MDGTEARVLPGSNLGNDTGGTDTIGLLTSGSIPLNDLSAKVRLLKHTIEDDLFAADLKWSLFVAACQSYKYDSLLRPFPQDFICNGQKDIERLRRVIEDTPAFPLLVEQLNNYNLWQQKYHSILLLTSILCEGSELRFRSIKREEFPQVMSLADNDTDKYDRTGAPKDASTIRLPTHIFEVSWSHDSRGEARWRQTNKNQRTFYAFHGSRLENFHSIMHMGLQQLLSKNGLFGQGIYLSSELGISLPYSPTGFGWGCSQLGPELSCIALCQIVDHPDVKYQAPHDASRALPRDSIGGKVPSKYFLVQNSDLVRIRYLLVYSSTPEPSVSGGIMRRWPWKFGLFLMMLSYVIILSGVGLSNNQWLKRYWKRLYRRWRKLKF